MKKVIAILAILSLVTLNLSSQTVTIAVNPTTVCLPVSGNVSVTVNYSYVTTFVTNFNASFTLQTTGGSSVATYSANGGTPTVTINAPNILNTGTLIAVLPSTISASSIRLVVYSGSSPAGNSTYFSLNVVSAPSITVTPSSSSLCIGNSVTLTASGANNYTWMPSTVSSTTSVSPVSNTIYTVSATNSLCPAVVVTSTLSITAYSVPVVSATGGSICAGKTYTIPVSGATSYSINNIAVSSPYTVAPTSNTTYSVKGMSSQGCVSSNTNISVIVNANPSVTVNSGSICAGQQFVIVPTGTSVTSYTYAGGSASVSPVSNANYIVTAYASSGCTATATSSVIVHALPVVSVNSGSICAGNSFVINPTGALSYTVAGGSLTVIPSSTTSYSVLGTSSVGCISNSVSSTVSVSALPIISVNSGSICAGQSFTITATGAASYAVSGSTMVVSPSTTSNYTVTGTSSVGCISSNTVVATVTVNQLPTVSVNSGTICAGKVFTINPTGASSYTVAGGSLTVSPSSNSTYTVIGSSSVGCVNTNPVTASVTVNAIPVISVSSTTNTLCQGSTATISAVGASSFVWAGNGNGSQIIVSPNVTTIYTVTGTDVNGCENTVNFTQTVVVCNTNTTGIADNSMNISSRIYPVPANNDLTIELGNVNDNIAVTITIYSLEGKIVMSNIQNLYNSTAKVELSTVQNGVYMLEVKSDSFRLVKNIIVAK
jgi:hypothetical protein